MSFTTSESTVLFKTTFTLLNLFTCKYLPSIDAALTCAKNVLNAVSTSLLRSSITRKSIILMKQVKRWRTPLHWDIWVKEGPYLTLPEIQKSNKGKVTNAFEDPKTHSVSQFLNFQMQSTWTSSLNILTLSSKQVMRIFKLIGRNFYLNLTPNSCN